MPSPRKKAVVKPAVSDEAVEAKTGKRWQEWFEQLDRAGARTWDHKTIAKALHEDYGLTFWWAQTVTVGYEQAVGLRGKHEMPDGYQIQRQRVAGVDADAAWAAIEDADRRHLWLPESSEARPRSTRADRRQLQLDWDGLASPRGRVLLAVQPKGEGKCAIGAMHSKLASPEAAEQAKALWTKRIEDLVARLEAGELR